MSSPESMALNAAPTASDPRYEQIDAEIAKLESALRERKYRRNSFAPISQLPTEILCAIFKFCSLPPSITHHEPQPYYYYRPDYNWHWVIVSHVSHHWRTAALNCPALWNKPDFSGRRIQWVHEMIKRSKDASLKIDVNTLSTSRGLDAAAEALTHLKRIEEIRLCVTSGDNMQKLLTPLLSLTSESTSSDPDQSLVPRLHTLSISIGHESYHNAAVPYSLPPDFLSSNGGASRLRRLELRHCHLPWSSALYKNLTHLTVSTSGPLMSTIDDFLGALEEIHELHELDLGGEIWRPCAPSQPSSSPILQSLVSSNPKSIVLPHLRTLRLRRMIAECATLLARICIPLTTCVHLQVGCADTPAKDAGVLRDIEELCRRLPLAQEQANVLIAADATSSRIKSMLAQTSMSGSGVLIEASYGAGSIASFSSSYDSDSSSSIPPTRLNKTNLSLDVMWPSPPRPSSSYSRNTKTRLDNQCRVLSSICSELPLSELIDLHVNFPLKLDGWDGRHGRRDNQSHLSDFVEQRHRGTKSSGLGRSNASIGDLESPMHTLASMFGALPKISSLTIEGHSAPGFVDVLGGAGASLVAATEDSDHVTESPSDASISVLPFPSLCSLSLLEVDFDRFDWQTHAPPLAPLSDDHTVSASSSDNNSRIDTSSTGPSDMNLMIRPLSDALTYRIQHHAPLRNLYLEGCAFLCHSSVEKLKEIVEVQATKDKGEVLQWDGLELVYADDDTIDFDEDAENSHGHGHGHHGDLWSEDEDEDEDEDMDHVFSYSGYVDEDDWSEDSEIMAEVGMSLFGGSFAYD